MSPGGVRIDGTRNPAVSEAHLDARSLELNKLFPRVAITRASFGKIHGDIDLKGRGNSVAQMLGTSSGNVAMLMGRGQISNLLLEVAGLDGAEIIKFLMGGDQNVTLRCAAAAFDVNRGLMNSRALVLDTTDTVIYGDGQVSLADEAIDSDLRPYPKDMSILSLRSPLVVAGSFAAPRVGPDKGALAGRAGLALALGAVNPLLALAATVETGPGRGRQLRAGAARGRVVLRGRPHRRHVAADAPPQKASMLGGSRPRRRARPRRVPRSPAARRDASAPAGKKPSAEGNRTAQGAQTGRMRPVRRASSTGRSSWDINAPARTSRLT